MSEGVKKPWQMKREMLTRLDADYRKAVKGIPPCHIPSNSLLFPAVPERTLVMEDGTVIPIDDVAALDVIEQDGSWCSATVERKS